MKTHQSVLKFFDDKVLKIYNDDDKNRMSSVSNELYCINKFSGKKNPYYPIILDNNKNSYSIKRYDFSLGNTKRLIDKNVRRLLFSCSLSEIFSQLKEIENILKIKNISHRDINPGNLLFSEVDLKLKLIDFYWAKTDNIQPNIPSGCNAIYGTIDSEAFSKIKNQLLKIDKNVRKQVKNLKNSVIPLLGKKYYDGSSKHQSKTYHQIDIPYFRNVKFHRDNSNEFQDINKNMIKPIKNITDVGCSSCYYLFNFMRMFRLEKVIGYEADPHMFKLLNSIKEIFCLDELIIKNKVELDTKFEKVDLLICMNVHMWLRKQFGLGADKLISNMITSSKEMFFQTAGNESSGMWVDKSLKSKEQIKKYLLKLGRRKVDFIRSTGKHGGLRHLFRIKNL